MAKQQQLARLYTVWDNGRIRRGSAREILEVIRARADQNDELQRLDVKEYARALIEDAAYLLDQKLFQAVSKQEYPTEFDRALHYLALMPSSRVRILSEDIDLSKSKLVI